MTVSNVGQTLCEISEKIDAAKRLCVSSKPNDVPLTSLKQRNILRTPIAAPKLAEISTLTPLPFRLSTVKDTSDSHNAGKVIELESELRKLKASFLGVSKVNKDLQASLKSALDAKHQVEVDLDRVKAKLMAIKDHETGFEKSMVDESKYHEYKNSCIRDADDKMHELMLTKAEEELQEAKLEIEKLKEELRNLTSASGNEEVAALRKQLETSRASILKMKEFYDAEKELNQALQQSAQGVVVQNEQLESQVMSLRKKLSAMSRSRSDTREVAVVRDEIDFAQQPQMDTPPLHQTPVQRHRSPSVTPKLAHMFQTPGPLAYGSPIVTPDRSEKDEESMPSPSQNRRTNSDPQFTHLRVDGDSTVIDINISSPRAFSSPKSNLLSPSTRLLRITQSLSAEMRDAKRISDKLAGELT